MQIRLSIQKFLSLSLLLTLGTTFTMTTLGLYYLSRHSIAHSLDYRMHEIGQALLAPLMQQHPYKSHSDTPIPKSHRYQLQVWNTQGDLLFSTSQSEDISFKSPTGLSDQTVNGALWRVLSFHDHTHGTVFALAEDYALRNSLIHTMMMDHIYLMLIVYLFSGIFMYSIIDQVLKKIHDFADEVAHRAIDSLEPINLQNTPIEFAPVIAELNKLFFDLKQAFEREQRFSADAAHELHTPLAALKTQAQVSLKTVDPEERVYYLQRIISGVDRCAHVVQQLLTLYRLSPGKITSEYFTQVDLAKITADAIAQLVPHAIEKNIDIELIAEHAPYFLFGNAIALYSLIRNLVNNAILYTQPGGCVRVLIHKNDASISLQVIDNGPGIPSELHTRVFERFFRVMGTHEQGSGLGLAIVEQIAKLHQGTVTLKTPVQGIGLEVNVVFLAFQKPTSPFDAQEMSTFQSNQQIVQV